MELAKIHGKYLIKDSELLDGSFSFCWIWWHVEPPSLLFFILNQGFLLAYGDKSNTGLVRKLCIEKSSEIKVAEVLERRELHREGNYFQYSPEYTSYITLSQLPKVGKKPPEKMSKNSALHSDRARQRACSHQLHW